MGPAMLLGHETEIAYRRETMLRSLARSRASAAARRTDEEGGAVTRGLRGRLLVTVLGRATVRARHA